MSPRPGRITADLETGIRDGCRARRVAARGAVVLRPRHRGARGAARRAGAGRRPGGAMTTVSRRSDRRGPPSSTFARARGMEPRDRASSAGRSRRSRSAWRARALAVPGQRGRGLGLPAAEPGRDRASSSRSSGPRSGRRRWSPATNALIGLVVGTLLAILLAALAARWHAVDGMSAPIVAVARRRADRGARARAQLDVRRRQPVRPAGDRRARRVRARVRQHRCAASARPGRCTAT